MRRRVFATAGAAAIGAATAVAALAIGTTTGFAATTTSSAYGVEAIGPLPIEPTPYVESTDGTTKTDSLAKLPDNPLLGLTLAEVSAGDDKASVTLADVALGGDLPEPPPELVDFCENLPDTPAPDLPLPEPPDDFPLPGPGDLPADNLQDFCKLILTPPSSLVEAELIEVSCDGDEGGVKIVGLKILGQEVPDVEVPEPNMGIPENPLLTLTANKQVKGDDGSFSVTGLEINVGDGAQIINLANATCGAGADDDDDDPTATPPPPVTTGLPVTG